MLTQASVEEKKAYIKESIITFLLTHVPDANPIGLDEILVSYIHSATEAVSTSPGDNIYLHLKELLEILCAYVEDFKKIERGLVYKFLLGVIKYREPQDEAAKPEVGSSKNIFSFYIPAPASKSSSNASSRSNSTSEDDCDAEEKPPANEDFSEFDPAEIAQALSLNMHPAEYVGVVLFLHEIFPLVASVELKHCVTIALGDLERSMTTVQHRMENGTAISVGTLPARTNKQPADNAQVKSRIIERYSYVDRESESKEHKPLAPKHAPKKMVRYRDNKIVSLKGERYTEVSKGDEEGVKKSNKKHHP